MVKVIEAFFQICFRPAIPKLQLSKEFNWPFSFAWGSVNSKIPMWRPFQLLQVSSMNCISKPRWIGPWQRGSRAKGLIMGSQVDNNYTSSVIQIQGIFYILGMSVFHLRDCVLRRAAFRPENLKRPPLSKYLPELGDCNSICMMTIEPWMRNMGPSQVSFYHCSFS